MNTTSFIQVIKTFVLIALMSSVLAASALSSPGDFLTEPPATAKEKATKAEQDTRIPGHYIVVLRDSVEHPGNLAETQTQRRDGELGFVYRSTLKGYSAELSKGAVQSLREDPRVRYVVPDQRVETFAQTIPTGIERIYASENEALDIDGEDDMRVDADVAVLDTGVDFEHPDLDVAGRTNCVAAGEKTSEAVEECIDNAGSDGHGHGTHVAGTIGAIDNGEGVVGVAPGARIWAVRVLNKKGSGAMSWIIAGIDWVTATREDEDPENDIEVVNMSLGCNGCDSKLTDDAISGYQEGSEHVPGSVDKGVVYVVAAGNSAADAANATPANNPDVITVSALADTDGQAGGEGPETCFDDVPGVTRNYTDDGLAYFSNWGSSVEIAAPGGCILSTFPGDEYKTLSGTSMASPHVAGAAALLASESNPDSKADVEAIREEVVEAGSLDLSHTAPDVPSPLLYLGEEPLSETEAITGGSKKIKITSAELTGAVNPRGVKTEYEFEYGTDTGYGKSVPVSPGSVEAGAGFTRLAQPISALEGNTTYHYRLVASNGEGTIEGEDRTFTTPQPAYTLPASDIAETEARLHGALYLPFFPKGISTTYHFEYGLTEAYGSKAVAEVDESEDEETELIYGAHEHAFVDLSELDPATKYHYRLIATNSEGTFYGEDQRLRTVEWAKGAGASQPMYSLSCLATDECMGVEAAFAAEWNGESWKSLSVPQQHEEAYRSVSCTSMTACMAVGEKYATERPAAMYWDGKSWAMTTTPLPAGATAGKLKGVSCVSSASCYAVGSYQIQGEILLEEYLAMHWDGKSWSLLPMPSAPNGPWEIFLEMNDVSCVGDSYCIAVGRETMRWDGEEWSRVTMPSPAIPLDAVSCVSTSACMAIGGHAEELEARRWNGEEWSVVPVGRVGKTGWRSYVPDISCATAWFCTAVGNYHFTSDTEGWISSPLAIHWDGEHWSSESVPFASREGHLGGVACTTPSHCMAVGLDWSVGSLVVNYDYAASAPTVSAEAEAGTDSAVLKGTVNGGSLPTSYRFEYVEDADYDPEAENPYAAGSAIPPTPTGIGSGSQDVEVSETIEGLETGATYHFRMVASNGEGTTYSEDQEFTPEPEWSLQSTPKPTYPDESSLAEVSCTAANACLAVGTDEATGLGMAERWDGEKWTHHKGTQGNPLSAVSCGSETKCFALGKKADGSAFTQRWAKGALGTAWFGKAEQAPATPEGGSEVTLKGISCSSNYTCTAVGTYKKEGATRTLAERYNEGTSTWSAQSTATTSSGSELSDVACPSASECIAVGSRLESGPKPLAERWNGTSWSVLTTPLPAEMSRGYLTKISCSSASSCIATGLAGKTSPNTSYVLHWDGSEWSLAAGFTGSLPKDLACGSATSCIAIGIESEKTQMQEWDGSEWSLQSSPNPEGKTPSFGGVACGSATACQAVGKASSGAESVPLGLGYE